MYKPDEDIDRLSRDAAEHYNAPGKPAWDALQQMLDKELPQEKEKKRRGFFFFFWLLLGLSVAGTGVWYGIKINNKQSTSIAGKKNTENKEPEPITTKQLNNTSATPENNAGPGGTTASANISKQPETINTAATDGSIVKQKITDHKTLPATAANTAGEKLEKKASNLAPADRVKNTSSFKNNNRPVTGAEKNNKLSTEKKTKYAGVPLSEKAISVIDKEQTSNKGSSHEKNTNKNITRSGPGSLYITTTKNKNNPSGNKGSLVKDSKTKSSNDESKNEVLTGVNANSTIEDDTKTGDAQSTISIYEQPLVATKDTAADKATMPQTVVPVQPLPATDKKDSAAIVKAEKKKSKSKSSKAINIGITAGIDESTVKFTHGNNAGYNIGLMGGYQFSKHWSVYTGAIYTKKNYKLDGKDFNPPPHYWTQYVNLQSVDGYCKMWEIPLLARYTFNPGAKTAFFVSTGLSSYFMTRQEYSYDYKNNMNQPMTGAWGTDSTFKHVFSILHLSAGFEKQIGKHMNWQIEPYAKIPLSGVGFGNIRLSSFGINFSVQYRHPVKR